MSRPEFEDHTAREAIYHLLWLENHHNSFPTDSGQPLTPTGPSHQELEWALGPNDNPRRGANHAMTETTIRPPRQYIRRDPKSGQWPGPPFSPRSDDDDDIIPHFRSMRQASTPSKS